MEQAAGAGNGDGQCPYPGAGRVIYEDGRQVDHGPYPNCGGARPTLRVVYEDWPPLKERAK
jgi:hypothetical protein